ncbi:MAG: F0F1 ATP synthase subunit delta [Actinobacteria bacterium]|nr:F0F1 ATP synthase subunit delta [Actinomycetota bacterium]
MVVKLRAHSQASFLAALERWNAVLEVTSSDIEGLALQLAEVVDTLDRSNALRRALSNPARDSESKATLVEDVFGGTMAPEVVDLLKGMARSRWSGTGDVVGQDADLPHALEDIVGHTFVAAAERAGTVSELADELFEVGRVLAAESGLRNALGGTMETAEERVGLLEDVFGGHVMPLTLAILRRVVSSDRHRSITAAIRYMAEFAAERRDLVIAVVTAAIPPNDDQLARLRAVLQEKYGRGLQLHVAVDPAVVGGLHISVGPEVYDGTLATRIERVRRHVG